MGTGFILTSLFAYKHRFTWQNIHFFEIKSIMSQWNESNQHTNSKVIAFGYCD